MKKILFIAFLSITTSIFIGCGGSGGGGSNNDVKDEPTESKDKVLKKGESLTCTKETKFSVTPTDKPTVNFSKNIEDGEVTITLSKDSKGYVTISDCTKK